ncbi:hypothetical protein RJ639_013700 [Escallonia herrerae]|uniref:Transposase-associated domain-containing protein n=1 Tax=Escallonia herrerae TaxID=1293975 RepID=A0AA88VHI0_9ASTE|nr:hypothetical protein RJ639_013700 [Escallonia herrerae]
MADAGVVEDNFDGANVLLVTISSSDSDDTKLWHMRAGHMSERGYTKSAYDSCMYHQRLADVSHIYLLVYVDDMLIAAKSISDVNSLKEQLKREFEMKDLSAVKRILWMKIQRDQLAGILYLSQKKYIERATLQTIVALSTTEAEYIAGPEAVKEAIWLKGLVGDLGLKLKVSMDKSWINIRNRLDPLYEKGADDFVKFASKDRPNATEILCPCTKCRNMRFVKKVDVAEHIVVDGFLSSYTHWIFHGESSLTSSSIPEPAVGDRTQEMIRDAFGVPMFNQLDEIGSGEGNEDSDGLDDATKKFFNLVQMLYEEGDEALSEEAISLAMGPLKKAERYTGYVINGFKYHTKARESNRATQHSGVMVKANTDSYASARDMNPIAGDVNYYGVLTDIIVLHYSKKFSYSTICSNVNPQNIPTGLEASVDSSKVDPQKRNPLEY